MKDPTWIERAKTAPLPEPDPERKREALRCAKDALKESPLSGLSGLERGGRLWKGLFPSFPFTWRLVGTFASLLLVIVFCAPYFRYSVNSVVQQEFLPQDIRYIQNLYADMRQQHGAYFQALIVMDGQTNVLLYDHPKEGTKNAVFLKISHNGDDIQVLSFHGETVPLLLGQAPVSMRLDQSPRGDTIVFCDGVQVFDGRGSRMLPGGYRLSVHTL